MQRRIFLFLTLTLGAPMLTTAVESPRTRVAIVKGQWHINGQVTHRGAKAEGVLMNVRMVNAVFEDANDRTRPTGFEPDANTAAFIEQIPDYLANGVRAFTLCLQGGHCGYEDAVNSAFNPDGSLRDSYLKRVRRVIEACDRHGAVVILGCYYQRQDQILKDEAAVRAGVVNVAGWIKECGFTHVMLEIANEFAHAGYEHTILKTPSGEAELIALAKKTAPGLLVSTSGMGSGRLPDDVARAGDFLLIHFNTTKLEDVPARIADLKKHGKPIVCNEDDKVGEEGANAAELCVANGASWGFMHSQVNQYFPKLSFNGAADDPAVYATLKRLTTPAGAHVPPSSLPGGGRTTRDAPAKEAAKEPDKRLHSDGSGWRHDQVPATDPQRPHVLLIGDSILNGYRQHARELLDGLAYVDTWTTPLHHASGGLHEQLAAVLAAGPYEVILFNLGHGWQKGRIPEGQYGPLTKKLAATLRTHAPKASLLWAASTPVTVKDQPGELHPEINPVIVDQNRMAAQAMRELNVPVVDYYGVLLPQLGLARGDQFHWKPAAYQLLARAGVDAIARELRARRSPAPATYFPPPESEGGWRKLDQPEDIRRLAGMDSDKLADLKQWLLDSDKRNFAAVVIRLGYIVLEVERGNSAKTDSRRVASVSKAVCATVLAIASEQSQQGKTPRKMTFDDAAFDFIPWAQPLSDPRKAKITVKQLFNHTSGISPEANNASYEGAWEYVLGHTGDSNLAQLAFAPGTGCGYSSHAFDHAALVCETVTGKPYDQFATEALFQPLGIEHSSFGFRDGGTKIGRHPTHGLGMPARDLARIAHCMMRDGRWGDRQVIPQWFAEETASPTHAVTTPELRWGYNADMYSHGWELPARMTAKNENSRHGGGIPADARYKTGSGGQLMAFVPSLDLVITRQTGGSGQWQYDEYLRRACQAVVKWPEK